MPDALLLDWEGSMVDTVAMRQFALQRALHDEGLVIGEDECGRCCDGASVDSSAQRALSTLGMVDPVLRDLIANRATRGFSERISKGFVMTVGVSELLANAQVTSRVAIVTLASRAETDFVLRLAGLDGAVSTIVTADDPFTAPPSPAPFLAALTRLAARRLARADHCIALASSAGMLRSARGAGLRAVAACAPAHVAIEADGAVDTFAGLTMPALSRIAGLASAERAG